MQNKKIIIVWLRNDLRLHDNEALWQATRDADQVLPLYIFDPIWYGKTSFGFEKTGAFRAQFIRETVENLRDNLRGIGADLLVRSGDSSGTIAELAKQFNAHAVYFQAEVTPEELQLERQLEKRLQNTPCAIKRFWGHTLFHTDDLPFSKTDLPAVFTAFRKKVEKQSPVRPLIPTPTKITLPPGLHPGDIPNLVQLGVEKATRDERALFKPRGGEDAALARLESYFWQKDLLKNYKETRDNLLGEDFSSKFSPWLACGAISPRYIYWQVRHYEEKRKKNISTYWLIFELIWRDFFRFQARKHGASLFHRGGFRKEKTEFEENDALFWKWANGQTGFPFIDANMQQLNSSGFMSNRGRQNVASFLVHNLKLDWRIGAEYFESKLVDYDVCSNWGNWAYIAGVGHDPRNRWFHIIKQAYEYDPHGKYVKHWLPVLKAVPDGAVQEVWRLDEERLQSAGLRLGEYYPEPVIDLDASYELLANGRR